MIDLNSNEFDVKEVKIFNEGNAGVVDNCTYEVIPKGDDEKERAPDWKIFFKDESGATTDKGFWFLDESREDFSSKLKYLGADLKHLVTAVKGADTKLPSFKNSEEMLNGIMRELAKYNNKVRIRVLVNYGKQGIDNTGFVKPSFYTPYVESMEIPLENTNLRQPKNAILTRPKPDSEELPNDVDIETGSGDLTEWA